MLSRTLTLAAGALLALGLTAPASSAQTLKSISPDEGTRGTVVTINGTDLGGKPKVWLTREGDKKKYKFKVEKGGTDSEVRALLKKAVAGEFTMHILPKGGEELTTSFDVLAPSIVSVEPSTASPGDEVVITVANGGGAKPKPKIYVGGQKAKVSGVEEQEDTFAGGGLFTLISAIMPKKIANGTWDVSIDNKVAEEIAEAALQITGSDVSIGKPTLSLEVDGSSVKLFKATIASAFIADRLHIQGGSKPNPARNITLWFQIDLENDTPPLTITPSLLDTLIYSETDISAFPPLPANWGKITDDWTITVNSISGGQVAGTYQGTLSPDGFNPSSENRVVSGEFIAEP